MRTFLSAWSGRQEENLDRSLVTGSFRGADARTHGLRGISRLPAPTPHRNSKMIESSLQLRQSAKRIKRIIVLAMLLSGGLAIFILLNIPSWWIYEQLALRKAFGSDCPPASRSRRLPSRTRSHSQ